MNIEMKDKHKIDWDDPDVYRLLRPLITLRKPTKLKCILSGGPSGPKEIEIKLSDKAEKELADLKKRIDPDGILEGVR